MAEVKHTPGPWSVSNGNLIRVNPKSIPGACICGVHKIGKFSGNGDTEALANARLIAAAPDLLEAMIGIEHFSDALSFRTDTLSVALRQWIDAGRVAIAKASPPTREEGGRE